MPPRKDQAISAKAAANWSISDIRYGLPAQLRPPPKDASLPALIPWLHELSKVSKRKPSLAQKHLRKAVLLRLTESKKIEKHEVTVADVKTALLRIREHKAKESTRRRKGLTRPKSKKRSTATVNQGIRRSARLNPQFQERTGRIIVIPSHSSESDSGSDSSSEDEATLKEIPETPEFLVASPSSIDESIPKHLNGRLSSPVRDFEEAMAVLRPVNDALDDDNGVYCRIRPHPQHLQMIPDTPYHNQSAEACDEDIGTRYLLTRIDRLKEEHEDQRRLARDRLASVARHRRNAKRHEAKIKQLEGALRAKDRYTSKDMLDPI